MITQRQLRCSSPATSIALLAVIACGESAGPPVPVGLKVTRAPSPAAETMIPLPTQPVLQLVDASANPVAVAGQLVTASVVGDAGQVVAGGSATTDASGAATFAELTLGARNGVVGRTTVVFAASNLTSGTSAVSELSCAIRMLDVGAQVSDRLATGDCTSRVGVTGTTAFNKEYRLNVTAATRAIRLSYSSVFIGGLLVRGPDEPTLGFGFLCDCDFAFKVLVPPGTSTITSVAAFSGVTGPFSFSVAAVPENEPECEDAIFLSPLSTSQQLRSGCTDAAGNIGDFFGFAMLAARTVSVSVTSSAFVPNLSIVRTYPTESVVATGTVNGNTASATHVNETGQVAYYDVFVTSGDGRGTGDYTLEATITTASGATVRSITGGRPGRVSNGSAGQSARQPVGIRPDLPSRIHRTFLHRKG